MKNKKTLIIIAVIVVLIIAGCWIFGGAKAKSKVDFATEKAQIGSVSNSITATGTIEPVTEVEVGTQVSGIIDKIYVDYNSIVKQGEIIAEMDRVTLLSDLQSAQATYNGAKAEYEYQKKLYERNRKLHEKQLISDTDYEQSTYDYQRAQSTYEQAQAELSKAERNLSYATITSPIDGIVTSKDVEEGQTVASGFETPTLFTIAADLTQMQVVADVDEADIAGVVDGAKVTFTVDAYPDDTFEGEVKQVRLGSVNSSSSTIYTQIRDNVLTVPAKALRFTPNKEIAGGREIKDCAGTPKVWTLENNVFTAHPVKTGLSDGAKTEIIEGLSEGTAVVTEAVVASPFPEMSEAGPQGERSPFMPGPPGRDKNKEKK